MLPSILAKHAMGCCTSQGCVTVICKMSLAHAKSLAVCQLEPPLHHKPSSQLPTHLNSQLNFKNLGQPL